MALDPAAPNWRPLAAGLGELAFDDDVIVVDVGAGRSHAIRVAHGGDVWEISGMVAPRQDLDQSHVSAVDLWKLNAQRCLTNYVVETDGSVWVTAQAPVAGSTGKEFAWLVRLVASEADRLEYRLTGHDRW